MDVVAVVPAYNEEKSIGRVVRGLFEHGVERVVVVDDGSWDNTAGVARECGAVVLRHALNRGQGAALQTGDEYARRIGAKSVVHFDADDQFNPADIAPVLEKMRAQNLDIIFGSRFLDSRSRVPALKKYLVLPLARVINYLFTGVWLSDAHNGFRVLNQAALSAVNITQDGMAHNSEIILQTRRAKLKFAEFPVEVRYREYGQGLIGGVKIIRDLIIHFFKK